MFYGPLETIFLCIEPCVKKKWAITGTPKIKADLKYAEHGFLTSVSPRLEDTAVRNIMFKSQRSFPLGHSGTCFFPIAVFFCLFIYLFIYFN